MKLTKEQIDEVIRNISLKAPFSGIKCSICEGIEWGVNNVVLEMREFQNGNLVIGGQSAIMPFVSITCKKCGNTLFINAIQLGLVSPESKEVQDNGQ